jgi:predicted dehydrogenase
MTKIGFIDHFLDEWHANNYPQFIKNECGDEFKVAYAYAEKDKENGLTTDEWCAKFGVERCATIKEVVEKSDVIIVLSPDNPERHLDLCREPLASGKRVYVDKTFALSKEVAREITEIAEKHNTPFWSSSALRFANELKEIKHEGICFINSRGPGNFDTYAIHQIEPIVCLMGAGAKRIMSVGSGKYESMVIEFENGRSAVMSHYGWNGGIDFEFTVSYEDGTNLKVPQMSEYFPNFIKNLCHFFKTGETFAAHDETISIMGIIEAGNKALKTPGIWVEI